ncbi:MAG: metallophosphoesterase family protein [Verrucomicrobiota bacterium]
MRTTALLILLTASLSADITRGPYVQMPEPNSVTLVWRTATPTTSTVDFGLTHACDAGHVALTNATTEHVVALTGLLAGTNYFYRVGDAVHELRTRRTAEQTFRFVVIGDFGAPTPGAAKIARLVNATDCDALLTVGDNVYPSGDDKDFDPFWFTPYAATMRRVPTFPALGNHDVVTNNGQAFINNFHLPANGPAGLLERNYSFDFGNAHFIALDSNPFATGDAKAIQRILDWTKRDLAGTQQPWKIAYFHHPAYTSLSNHDETPAVRKQLMPVLEAAGVQLVFTGHNHFYERIRPQNGVLQIITGGSGQVLYPVLHRRKYSEKLENDRHSFTVVEITGPTLQARQIDEDGQTIDTFKLTR